MHVTIMEIKATVCCVIPEEVIKLNCIFTLAKVRAKSIEKGLKVKINIFFTSGTAIAIIV